MNNAGSEDERRGFSSRTPDNNNPDRVRYRRGFVTKHQVTGWRFVMRRLSAGVAMHDARMLVDPLRSQSRALTMPLRRLCRSQPASVPTSANQRGPSTVATSASVRGVAAPCPDLPWPRPSLRTST